MKLIAAFVLLCGLAAGNSVIKMLQQELMSEAEEEDRLLYTFLMAKPYRPFKRTGRLSTYIFTNCGDPKKEAVVVSKLLVAPDPVPEKGTITVTFNANVTRPVVGPVKASVEIKKEVFGVWIPVPCVDNFGSCNYADFCALLPGTCPQPFIQNNVPCHCPLPTGNYTLPGISLDVNLSILPSGGYKAQLDLSNSNGSVGCYAVQFTVS